MEIVNSSAVLTSEQKTGLTQPVTREEVKRAVFFLLITNRLDQMGSPQNFSKLLGQWCRTMCLQLCRIVSNMENCLNRFFSSKRGLRQGGLDVRLSLCCGNGVSVKNASWACFADDIMLFCRCDEASPLLMKGMVQRLKFPLRFSFTCWLLMQQRRKTRVLLSRRGTVFDKTCIFAAQDDEHCKHLFFECLYSKQVWQTVLAYIELWIQTAAKGRSSRAMMIKILFGRSETTEFSEVGTEVLKLFFVLSLSFVGY